MSDAGKIKLKIIRKYTVRERYDMLSDYIVAHDLQRGNDIELDECLRALVRNTPFMGVHDLYAQCLTWRNQAFASLVSP